MVRTVSLAFLLLVAPGATVSAQQPNPIPIRKVTTLASTDSGVVDNVYVMQPRSDGRVLLNDASKRRLVLFDSTLKTFKIIADTAGQSKNSFGNNNSGGLLFYPGDSAAFVDRSSAALVVVDKDGNFGHVTTPPKASDIGFFAGSAYGVPGFDVQGRLYYRGVMRPPAMLGPPAAGDTLVSSPDSAPIIRADFDARRIDTVATMRIPFTKQRLRRVQDGYSFIAIINPLPFTDEWAYLSDGTVAIVRGQDYHVDWYLPDGSKKSTPKMPFDWRRLTDEDKQKMVDSVHHVVDSTYDATLARLLAAGATPAIAARFSRNEVVKANELPDYYPPVRNAGQMRVDLAGNLWIMPTTSLSAKGGTLYDVVNRRGEIIERVQLPEGRNLHGFGPGGIIYMSVPGGYSWPRIERARVERPAGAQ